MRGSGRIRDEKEISGCAISGIMSESGRRFGGGTILRSIANMHDRSNGLGGGFAAYGIYPDRADQYALHVMYDDVEAVGRCEDFIRRHCDVQHDEPIPIRPTETIRGVPRLHRYFVTIRPEAVERHFELSEDDIVVHMVMRINAIIDGAFVFSSGKDMGVFKGVGFPEEIGRFYRLEEYEAYIWTAHGRFPTNTTGWWGGAHPFGLLDWSVVHNGEISSYGINRRYLANFGYHCGLQTDTEVITYLFDLLMRKHGLPLEAACMALAPPFWTEIERMDPEHREVARTIRTVYGGALLNGPFSVLVARRDGMIGFNDRIKLRPMVAARKDDMLYVASEEAAIRVVADDVDVLWHAKGGVPIVGTLKGGEPAKETSVA
ncbi:MAG TPA: glutamine amidotransferase family protein [Planctomycetota bacterium]|nr:glutamine amidotransferase family protein [Planctomycetota bacterium]